jgi:hypothetical protein
METLARDEDILQAAEDWKKKAAAWRSRPWSDLGSAPRRSARIW